MDVRHYILAQTNTIKGIASARQRYVVMPGCARTRTRTRLFLLRSASASSSRRVAHSRERSSGHSTGTSHYSRHSDWSSRSRIPFLLTILSINAAGASSIYRLITDCTRASYTVCKKGLCRILEVLTAVTIVLCFPALRFTCIGHASDCAAEIVVCTS